MASGINLGPIQETKLTMHWFLKVGHSRPLFIYFGLFITVDNKQMFNKILPMTGVNRVPMVLKATALPTEPQPLPHTMDWFLAL